MSLALALASVVACLATFVLAGVVPAAARTATVARRAFATIGDRRLEDAAKELVVRRAGLELLGLLVAILVRSALALAAGLLPLWLAAALGLEPAVAALDLLKSWELLFAASAAAAAIWLVGARAWRA